MHAGSGGVTPSHALALESSGDIEGATAIRATTRVLVGCVGLTAIVWYFIVASVAGALPSTPAFPGWVTVLVPTTSETHQVRFVATPLVPGAPGAHPTVTYLVSVCGTSPFHAVLLMGGAARLTNATFAASDLTTKPIMPTSLKGTLDVPATGDSLVLSDTAWVPIDIPSVVACAPSGTAGFATLGTPVEVTGNLRAPVRHHPRVIWATPRESQSWPLIGRPPGVSSNDLGEFRITGIPGSWSRPVQFTSQVSVGNLGHNVQVESSQPALESTETLSWSTSTPIAPSARLIDVDEQALWQSRLTTAGIGLGIGCSLLAALPFEIAATRTGRLSRPGVQNEEVGQRSSERSSAGAWFVVVLVLLHWLFTRRPRRNRSQASSRQ